jgi:hypothetical protein
VLSVPHPSPFFRANWRPANIVRAVRKHRAQGGALSWLSLCPCSVLDAGVVPASSSASAPASKPCRAVKRMWCGVAQCGVPNVALTHDA